MASLLGVLLFAQVEGHVKFFFSDNTVNLLNRPIRNAPGPQSDGVMSTSGPCGGDIEWAANGFSYAKEGDEIYMKINYNGGHKSADNQFRAAWVCAEDGTNNLPQSLLEADDAILEDCTVENCPEPVTGSSHLCGASIGNDHEPGYIFKCSVPGSTAGRNCSISVLDQRDWGGCYDLMVETIEEIPPAALATPTPIGAIDEEVIGMYILADDTEVIENAPDGSSCCVLNYGEFFVFEMEGSMRVLSDVKAKCGGESFVHNSVEHLVKDALGPVWRADITMGVTGDEQQYELSLSDGILMLTQLDPDAPQFCDFAVSRKQNSSGGRPLLSGFAMLLTIVSAVILI